MGGVGKKGFFGSMQLMSGVMDINVVAQVRFDNNFQNTRHRGTMVDVLTWGRFKPRPQPNGVCSSRSGRGRRRTVRLPPPLKNSIQKVRTLEIFKIET
jgi:hypothetical protein